MYDRHNVTNVLIRIVALIIFCLSKRRSAVQGLNPGVISKVGWD